MNLRTIAAAAATALAAATVAVLGPTPLAHAGPADAPRAYDRYVTTPYGVAWQGNLCTGAWDAQGDKVKVASVAAAPLTAVYDETTCAITLTPYAGASGPFDVTFRLTDGTNLGDPVRLRITVGKDGDLAPVAQPDSFATGKDLKLIIPDMKATLAANDSDPEGHALTVISFSNPENAMLPGESLLGASQFGPNAYLYTPPTGFVGTRRFYYSVTEGSTVTRQLWTVEITDKGVPKTPVTAPDAYVAPKDGVLKVAKPNGVLGNDVDEDSAYMSVGAYTYPSHGTLTIDDTYNGTFTYTPKPGYVGPDEFEYVARDAENHQSGYTKVSLTVKTLAPVAGNDTFKVVRDGTLVIPMADLTANDSDGDSAFSVASTLPAANGTVVADYAAKTVTYTPKPGWTGNDFFGYRLQDPDGNVSNWATVSVGVVAPDVNQAPVSKNDAYSVHQGKSLVVPAAQGPLANDADLEAADIDIHVMGQPAHGDVTVVDKETGAFTYVPDATWNGVDTLTYTAVDPKGAVGAPATISITVVNDAPIAVDDHYTAISGEPLKVAAAAGVLANDTDPEGQQLTSGNWTLPQHGTVQHDSIGAFAYTPAAGFVGTETLHYTALDPGQGESASATITIEVVAPELVPGAVDVTGTARVGRTLTAVPGVWGPYPAELAYQWLRDGTPIAGATSATYLLTAADRGRAVSVRVTGSRDGFPDASATSPVRTVLAGILSTSKPKILGIGRVGRTLQAAAGTWGPGVVVKTYRWYRNGVAIKGATRASYLLTRADKARRITVRVTGRKAGYQTVTRASGYVVCR